MVGAYAGDGIGRAIAGEIGAFYGMWFGAAGLGAMGVIGAWLTRNK